jgi:DNA polymerase
MNKLFIDFESYSESDIKKSGADVYARHHTTGVLCMAFALNDDPIQVYIPKEEQRRAMHIDPISFPIVSELPEAVLDHVLQGGAVVAHNYIFDYLIWNNCTNWPQLTLEQADCTSARASAMALPASLGMLGEALSVEIKKSPTGTRLITKMCKPPFQTGPALMAEMAEYCGYDVASMREIDKRLMPLSPSEREVWLVNSKINQRGLRVDYELINNSIFISGQEDLRLIEITEAKWGLNGTALRSPKQMLEFCAKHGEELPNLSKATLATATIKSPEVQEVLDIRAQVCKSSIKKFYAMMLRMCDDERIRGNHVYHRATTGRFAGSGMQVQNLPRPQLKDPDAVADYVVAHGKLPDDTGLNAKDAVSSLLRSAIIPEEGHEFYCADYSAIESRVLFWLADEQKGLDVYREGLDLYCVTASNIFGYPINKREHSHERSIGKVAVLSCGYGGGKIAFQGMCDSMGVDLDGRDPQTIVNAYRDGFVKVKRFWDDCEQACIEAILQPGITMHLRNVAFKYSTKRQALACRLPSGRLIQWPFASVDKEGKTPWGSTATQVTYMGTNLAHKWVQQRTYGGDIAQSLTQAVARDMLTDAMVRIEKAGFPVVLHVHDEIMVEMPEGANRYNEFEEIMSTPATWATDCPIAVAGFKAKRYQK